MYAAPREAHLNTTGMGPIYDGMMHFLMSPEDFVPVLALALLAGLRGAAYGRRALFVLPVAWLLGGFDGLSAVAANPHPFIAAGWFLLLGALLAADAKLSLRVTTARWRPSSFRQHLPLCESIRPAGGQQMPRRARPAHARVGRPDTLAEAPGDGMRIHLMTTPEMRYCPRGFVLDERPRP
jgi:hypothetical protein